MLETSRPDVDAVMKTARTYARDLAERVVATFLQAFVGALILTSPFDLGMWQAAAMGGVAAALSLIKGMLARARSVSNSASLAKGV
ncbi:holin [Streptomyces sp. NPDC090119]|uniref:holin n=1 Tax=Streptomyces sp. NPDC090119 TaxID=3365951 RepID=UPI00381BF95F